MPPLPPIERDRKVANLSTFGIGGPARFFAVANSKEEAKALLVFCKKEAIPYVVLGKGSNILFPDDGYPGLVILNKISFFEQDGSHFHVGAGFSFSRLGVRTARSGWTGLEFAAGIPGSVGGAVVMNAGANGGEVCNVLESVDWMDPEGNEHCLKREDLEFSYRTSSLQKLKGLVVGATFCLLESPEAKEKQIKILDYRMKTQPYGEKSAGCAFINPEGTSAGALIEQCGLKGLSVGGAEISRLHGNFIVNRGGATAGDVQALMEEVKKRVKEKRGIELKAEIRLPSATGEK